MTSPQTYTSAREAMRAVLGQTRPKLPYILKMLEAAKIIPIITKYRYGGSGTIVDDPILSPEQFEAFTKYLIDWKAEQDRPKAKAKAKANVESAGFVGPVLAELVEWRKSMEEMILDQEGRIDSFHKYLEVVDRAYKALLANVDPDARKVLPEPPALPPKYRYKVVILGSDQRVPNALRRIFPDIKFLHPIETGQTLNSKQTLPRGDLVLYMKNFSGHEVWNMAVPFYGKDGITMVNGSTSAAESIIHLWLTERRKEKEAQQQ